MPSTAHVNDQDRHDIWNRWLDGDTVNRIHAYQAGDNSRGVIKAVLGEDPPETIRSDPRLIHGGRFFWISVSHHYPKAGDGTDMVMVFAKMPYRMTGRAFARGVRSIRRDYRGQHPESDLTLGVIEGIEAEVAIRFVAKRGYLGWSMDTEGSILPLTIAEPKEAPSAPSMSL